MVEDEDLLDKDIFPEEEEVQINWMAVIIAVVIVLSLIGAGIWFFFYREEPISAYMSLKSVLLGAVVVAFVIVMDLTTVLGLSAGIFLLAKAAGGSLSSIYDLQLLLFVLGGGFAATMVAYPLKHIVSMVSLVRRKLLFYKSIPQFELVEKIVGFAAVAHQEGIQVLEQNVQEVDNAFLAAGNRLAVEGAEPEYIRSILNTEMKSASRKHRTARKLIRGLGTNWILFGGIGTLVVLGRVAGGTGFSIDLVSPAVLPLLYGFLLAGLVGFPFSRKLEVRSEEEMLEKQMMLQGVLSIRQGDHPRITEQKLLAFLARNLRPADEDDYLFEDSSEKSDLLDNND